MLRRKISTILPSGKAVRVAALILTLVLLCAALSVAAAAQSPVEPGGAVASATQLRNEKAPHCFICSMFEYGVDPWCWLAPLIVVVLFGAFELIIRIIRRRR